MTSASTDAIVQALKAAGYTVIAPSEALNDQLLNRMQGLASDLQVIDGLTKRGAALPEDRREGQLQSLRQYAERIFDALYNSKPVRNPWDRKREGTDVGS